MSNSELIKRFIRNRDGLAVAFLSTAGRKLRRPHAPHSRRYQLAT